MLLSDINGSVCIDSKDNYHVGVAPGDHLTLRMGFTYGNAGCNFEHRNLLARFYDLLEFKHERSNGSKFWTAKAGVELYFAVPKDHIELVMEKGYSYPKVIIGGEQIVLSVSAGTSGHGWGDSIHSTSSTLVNLPRKKIIAIAENAISIAEAKQNGIFIEEDPQRNYESAEEHKSRVEEKHKNIQALIVKATLGPTLNKGMSVVIQSDRKVNNHGPHPITHERRKRKRYVLAYGYRIQYNDIDWLKTAEANNFPLPPLVNVNRVPKP